MPEKLLEAFLYVLMTKDYTESKEMAKDTSVYAFLKTMLKKPIESAKLIDAVLFFIDTPFLSEYISENP